MTCVRVLKRQNITKKIRRLLVNFHVCLGWFCAVRFRSIAKSYFRRADGVLLLYDVTCESSFLNVREWVDMIEVMWLTLLQTLAE